MPDVEDRIKEGLDRLRERPDPGEVVSRVSERKRRRRMMRWVQTVTLVAVVLAGTAGGMYALAHTFGIRSARTSPGSTGVRPKASPLPTVARSRPSTVLATPLCSDRTARAAVVSQTGSAGTIRTVWEVTNTSSGVCHSYGYPGMDFHASSGWLRVHVQPGGGYQDIDQPPTPIVVPAGQSLYLISYWSDVSTSRFPRACKSFNRVMVTQPDNTVSVVVVSSGCLNPFTVKVGPVTRTRPS